MGSKFVKARGHALVMLEDGVFRTVDPGSVIECASEEEAKDYERRGLGEVASGPATFKQTPPDAPARIEFGTLATDQAERADASRQSAKDAGPAQPPGKK